MVRIASASSHRWRVPIAAQLPASQIPAQGVKGRLVVNVALSSKAKGHEQPTDEQFELSLLTLSDMDVLFTRAALEECNTAAAAEP